MERELTRDEVARTIGEVQGALVLLIASLAVRLINAGIADREDVISEIEKMGSLGAGDPTGSFATVADALKKTRPWGVIEGGKSEPDPTA